MIWIKAGGNEKARHEYLLEGEGADAKVTHLRAFGGHSAIRLQSRPNQVLLTKDNVRYLYHGTKHQHIHSIRKLGLRPGGMTSARNDIFFSATDPKSQKRFRTSPPDAGRVFILDKYEFDSQDYVCIDMHKAMDYGCAFFQTVALAVVTPDAVPADCIA